MQVLGLLWSRAFASMCLFLAAAKDLMESRNIVQYISDACDRTGLQISIVCLTVLPIGVLAIGQVNSMMTGTVSLLVGKTSSSRRLEATGARKSPEQSCWEDASATRICLAGPSLSSVSEHGSLQDFARSHSAKAAWLKRVWPRLLTMMSSGASLKS